MSMIALRAVSATMPLGATTCSQAVASSGTQSGEDIDLGGPQREAKRTQVCTDAALKSLLAARGATKWGRPETLARHFRDHGAQFGARNADDYARMADDFFEQSQRGGLPTKIGPDGTIRAYDPATNTFGSFNPNGTTRTFFKPDPSVHGYPTNLDYWNAQPGAVPWTP
jgi:pyocin large subunit-like protein